MIETSSVESTGQPGLSRGRRTGQEGSNSIFDAIDLSGGSPPRPTTPNKFGARRVG
jgi:hypothetical protein